MPAPVNGKVCTVPGCERKYVAKGYCQAHYRRWRAGGDAGARAVRPHGPVRARKLGRRPVEPLTRFRAKTVRNEATGCIEWTAGLFQKDGYGQFQHGGRPVMAHRFAYETFVGPIPEGMEVDHLCFNRLCQNVEHMELVTKSENLRRMHAHKKEEVA